MRTRRNKMVLRAAAIAAAIGLTTLLLSAPTWGAKGGGTARYTIVPLDTRPGYQSSYASDVNEVGDVVGYLEDADRHTDAVAWEVTVSGGTASVVERFLPGGFDESAAFGVNDNGGIVGSSVVGGMYDQAVYWKDAASAPLLLPPLPGQAYCWAGNINNDGVVVGWSSDAANANRRAVAWRVGPAGNLLAGPVDLGVLSGGSFSVAGDVSKTDATSGNVHVVGDSGSTEGLRAVLWEINALTLAVISGPENLGVLSDDQPFSSGYAINDQSTTCGQSGYIAFRKPYGNPMQQLAQFKPGQTWAFGINNRNEVVGKNDYWRNGAWQGSYPVMWQADGKVLNLNGFIGSSGWYYIANPRAINDNGWIAAHGGNSVIGQAGESRALVMVPK